MRISDWSSDVCSSDLLIGVCIGKIRSDNNCAAGRIFTEQRTNGATNDFDIIDIEQALIETLSSRNHDVAEIDAHRRIGQTAAFPLRLPADGEIRRRLGTDRQSVVQGKRVSVRGALGGPPML